MLGFESSVCVFVCSLENRLYLRLHIFLQVRFCLVNLQQFSVVLFPRCLRCDFEIQRVLFLVQGVLREHFSKELLLRGVGIACNMLCTFRVLMGWCILRQFWFHQGHNICQLIHILIFLGMSWFCAFGFGLGSVLWFSVRILWLFWSTMS